MKTTARLAVFAAGLAVVFVSAFLVGGAAALSVAAMTSQPARSSAMSKPPAPVKRLTT